MEKLFKSVDEDLHYFKSDLLFTDLAEDLINDLFYKYGRQSLNYFMEDSDLNFGIHEMELVKNKMEEYFLVDICSRNECLIEKIKLYELFPNSKYLIGGMYPEHDIVEKLISNEWINEFKTWEYPNLSHWWVVDKSFLFKGEKWDTCPQPIKDHFLKLKGE
jgi:hypothetical protein